MAITGASQHVYHKAFGGNAAECYERYFVPVIGGPFADDLVAAAALRPGERVLDVACGTGVVARRAADHVGPNGSVAGVDVNAGMLAVARAAAVSVRPAIQWYETTAEAMPLPDSAFDVVFCQLGLQFVPDKIAALREMRRVLAPGGRAYVSVPTPTRFFDVLDSALDRLGLPAAAAFVRLVFSVNDPRELERLLATAGFGDADVTVNTKRLRLPSPKEFLWQYVESTPLAAAIAQLDETHRATFERDVVTRWQDWLEDGGITYEQSVLVGSARR